MTDRRIPFAPKRALKWFIALVLALTLLAATVVFIQGSILNAPYPRNTVIFDPDERFSDFTDIAERLEHFGESDMLSRTDIDSRFPYPPPGVYAYLLFMRLFGDPIVGYTAVVLLAIAISAVMFYRKLTKLGSGTLLTAALIATVVFTSYPFAFLLDRGNLEGVLWILILAGVWAYARNKPLAAAVLLGLAASFKIFPALLFTLFLARRDYRNFVVAIASAVLFFCLALAGFGSNFQQTLHDFSVNAVFLRTEYIIKLRPAESGFDHSLFSLVKQVLAVWLPNSSSVAAVADKLTTPYAALVLTSVFLLYFFRMRRLPILNQFMAYIVLSVLLPYVSNDYTLVHLYIAWGAFIIFLVANAGRHGATLSTVTTALILSSFAILFTPQTYFIVGANHGFGGLFKTAALLVLLFAVLREPMPSSLFNDLPGTSTKKPA